MFRLVRKLSELPFAVVSDDLNNEPMMCIFVHSVFDAWYLA